MVLIDGAAKLPITWEMGLLRGGLRRIRRLSTHLPTHPNDVYAVDAQAPATRTAGSAIAAVIARPCGGVLCRQVRAPPDHVHLVRRCRDPGHLDAHRTALEILAGINFVLMALFAGLGSGSVFTWVAQVAPAERVGAVTGSSVPRADLRRLLPTDGHGGPTTPTPTATPLGLALLSVFAVAAALITAFVIRKQDRT